MIKKIDLKTYTKPTDFARLLEGENKIILISEGGMVRKHGMKTARGYIPLGDCSETPDCEWCQKGNEAKLKWIWVAYISGQVKVLDVGPMIGDGICRELQRHGLDRFTNAIFNIKRIGTGRETRYEIKYVGQNQEKLNVESAKNFLVKKYFQSR